MFVSRPGSLVLPFVLGIVVSLSGGVALADTDAPTIDHEPPQKAPRGAQLVIRAKISDASEVFAPSVAVRIVDDQPCGDGDLSEGGCGAPYETINMQPKGEGYEAIIPAKLVTSNLEYFIEAFDEHGNGPARVGSPDRPLTIEVFDPAPPPPAPPPALSAVDAPPLVTPPVTAPVEAEDDDDGILGQWWFWTVVGAAVLGSAGGIALALRPAPLVDSVNIRVQGPDPTRGL